MLSVAACIAIEIPNETIEAGCMNLALQLSVPIDPNAWSPADTCALIEDNRLQLKRNRGANLAALL